MLLQPTGLSSLCGRQHSCQIRRSSPTSYSVVRVHTAAAPRQAALQHRLGSSGPCIRIRQTQIAAAQGNPDQQEYEEFEEAEEDGGFEQDDGLVDDADAFDEEAEAPLDEESLRIRQAMAAQAGPSTDSEAAAAEEGSLGLEEEEEPPFPEAEERAMLLSDLFGLSGELDIAEMLQEDYPEVFATGITDSASSVLPGDVYCCVERMDNLVDEYDGHEPEEVSLALENGAIAIVAARQLRVQVPEGVPVIHAEDVDELAGRLAAIFFDTPSTAINTIAVTGSSGKTTAAWLIRGVLEYRGDLTGMIGSIEHALAEHVMTPDGQFWKSYDTDPAAGRECSSPFALVPYRGRYHVDETTPSSLHMQKLLAGMRDRGATAAVVECTASGIAGGSTDYLDPNIVVFTNLMDNPSDLELFGSKQEYLDAMLQMFRELKDPDTQRAVINADDEHHKAVRAACPDMPCVTYGINNPAADVRAEELALTLWSTTMIVATPVGKLEIISNMVGRHNVYNILAAVAVGVLLNIPLQDIGAGIESVLVVPGRCEVVNMKLEGETEEEGLEEQNKLPQDFPVIVDAADTPQRLAAVLQTIREAGGDKVRVFTVFGCDGMTSTGETRARMGEVAHQRSEFVILTNSSPRLEEPGEIIQDIVAGWPNEVFEPYAAYVYNVFQDQTRAPLWFEPFLHSAQRRWKRHIMEDRFQAIRAAIGTAGPGDVVLLAGRGHRDFVEHWDGEHDMVRGWFDDRVEARNALSKLEYLYALVNLDRSALPWGPPGGPDAKSVVVELEVD